MHLFLPLFMGFLYTKTFVLSVSTQLLCNLLQDWKQMPVVTSTLLRELYLIPSNKKETKDFPCINTQLNELPEKSKEPWPKTPDESPDSSQTQVRPIHMPCSCFLEYFEYLKKCLE